VKGMHPVSPPNGGFPTQVWATSRRHAPVTPTSTGEVGCPGSVSWSHRPVSSVVEHSPCKRAVVRSIRTRGSNMALIRHFVRKCLPKSKPEFALQIRTYRTFIDKGFLRSRQLSSNVVRKLCFFVLFVLFCANSAPSRWACYALGPVYEGRPIALPKSGREPGKVAQAGWMTVLILAASSSTCRSNPSGSLERSRAWATTSTPAPSRPVYGSR
jgi:hypothetical protein